MKKRTIYEWAIEVTEDGNIVDHEFSEKLKTFGHGNVLNLEENLELVLVKTILDDEMQSIDSRTWAYVDAYKKLPKWFTNGDIVPQRFHNEIEAYSKRINKHAA